MEFDWVWLLIRFLISSLVLTYALIGAGFWTLILRKFGARIQQRLGPNRVGPGGMFQWAADLLKMLLKEPILPADPAYNPHQEALAWHRKERFGAFLKS